MKLPWVTYRRHRAWPSVTFAGLLFLIAGSFSMLSAGTAPQQVTSGCHFAGQTELRDDLQLPLIVEISCAVIAARSLDRRQPGQACNPFYCHSRPEQGMKEPETMNQEAAITVAHELRTPLTALVTSLELLPDSHGKEAMRHDLSRMRRLLEGILHTPVRIQQSSTDLEKSVSSILADCPPGAPWSFTVVAPRQAVYDETALERCLLNLLQNASCHGKPPISVILHGTTVTVKDAGSGFRETMLGPSGARSLAELPLQPWAGAGMIIAARSAHSMGAELKLENNPNGSSADLTLQEGQA